MGAYQTNAALVVLMSSAVTSIQFALLPEILDLTDNMIGVADVGAAASSAQECVDLVAVAEPAAIAISFDSTTGACKYSTSIYSYYRRTTGKQPSFYLRTDTVMKKLSEPDCLTRQDGEYLIALLSFDDDQCPQSTSTYDSVSGLCTTPNADAYDLDAYAAGRLQDGTTYMLSRDKALEAISYECDTDDILTYKWVVGGVWYCSTVLGPATITSEDVRDNVCASTAWTGSAVVKISNAREYGFLRDAWSEYTIYLGLYLDGTSWLWYDGSEATDLPWAVGRPLGDPANDMAYLTSDLTLVDGNGNDTDVFCCKKEGTNVGYDPTAKFL